MQNTKSSAGIVIIEDDIEICEWLKNSFPVINIKWIMPILEVMA